jgi:hypothetical protein
MTKDILERFEIFMKTNVDWFDLYSYPSEISPLIPELWRPITEKRLPCLKAIEYIWRPIGDYGAQIARILSKNCSELRFLYAPKDKIPIRLCYVYNPRSLGSEWIHCWVGNPPIGNDLQNVNANISWPIPNSYKLFTKIHNGLTRNGNKAESITSSSDLRFFSKTDPFPKENISYKKPGELLEFSSDGEGNLQCFDFDQPQGDDFLTVLWDHETQETYNPIDFWSFIMHFLNLYVK